MNLHVLRGFCCNLCKNLSLGSAVTLVVSVPNPPPPFKPWIRHWVWSPPMAADARASPMSPSRKQKTAAAAAVMRNSLAASRSFCLSPSIIHETI